MKLVYATGNPGKFEEARKFFGYHNLELNSPSEFGVKVEVDEVGKTLEENARLKALAYQKALPHNCIVIGDDTGVEIDELGGDPGIHVRRWKGYEMTDQEIVEHCLSLLKTVPLGKRGAQFRTVLAVSVSTQPVKYFEGIRRGVILRTPTKHLEKGMPFWSIFYLSDLNMSLGEFHTQPLSLQLEHPTHRERAFMSALPYIKGILGI